MVSAEATLFRQPVSEPLPCEGAALDPNVPPDMLLQLSAAFLSSAFRRCDPALRFRSVTAGFGAVQSRCFSVSFLSDPPFLRS